MQKGEKRRIYNKALRELDPESRLPPHQLATLLKKKLDLTWKQAESAVYAYHMDGGRSRILDGSRAEYERLLNEFAAEFGGAFYMPPKEAIKHLIDEDYTEGQAKGAVYKYRQRKGLIGHWYKSEVEDDRISTILDSFSLPEELSDTETFLEGAKRQITVNTYERSDKARQECIDYHGPKCAVCGFDFPSKYGAVGVGLIHVHHIIPLSEVDEGYEVDPKEDLRPVCPNCHAIIHRRKPAYEIEEVKQFIKRVV